MQAAPLLCLSSTNPLLPEQLPEMGGEVSLGAIPRKWHWWAPLPSLMKNNATRRFGSYTFGSENEVTTCNRSGATVMILSGPPPLMIWDYIRCTALLYIDGEDLNATKFSEQLDVGDPEQVQLDPSPSHLCAMTSCSLAMLHISRSPSARPRPFASFPIPPSSGAQASLRRQLPEWHGQGSAARRTADPAVQDGGAARCPALLAVRIRLQPREGAKPSDVPRAVQGSTRLRVRFLCTF